jgi:hypothetical protein
MKVHGPSSEVGIATGTLKKCRSPRRDQIPAELIQTVGETLSAIHKLSNSIWNKEEMPDQWKESIIVFTKRVIQLTNNYHGYHCHH